jgi:hypothetical protein
MLLLMLLMLPYRWIQIKLPNVSWDAFFGVPAPHHQVQHHQHHHQHHRQHPLSNIY